METYMPPAKYKQGDILKSRPDSNVDLIFVVHTPILIDNMWAYKGVYLDKTDNVLTLFENVIDNFFIKKVEAKYKVGTRFKDLTWEKENYITIKSLPENDNYYKVVRFIKGKWFSEFSITEKSLDESYELIVEEQQPIYKRGDIFRPIKGGPIGSYIYDETFKLISEPERYIEGWQYTGIWSTGRMASFIEENLCRYFTRITNETTKEEVISNTKNKTNATKGTTIEVQRSPGSVSTGKRPTGNSISGRTSQSTIGLGHLSNKAVTAGS